MISVVPLIARALEPGRWLARTTVVVLALLGLVVQIAGVSVFPYTYSLLAEQTLPPGAPWNEMIWTWQHAPIAGHWRLILDGQLGFAWYAAFDQPDWWLGGGLLAVAVVSLWWLARATFWQPAQQRRVVLLNAGLLLVVMFGVTGFSLRRIYPDVRYRGDNEALHAMRRTLETTTLPDPVIYLNNRTYFDFMLNYYKGDAMWYTLEFNPNEAVAEGEERPHPRENPRDYVNDNAWSRVDYFGRQHETMILVMETGPFDVNIIRPMEWWMNDVFFKIGEETYAERLRLVYFSSDAAPAREAEPPQQVNWQVGDVARVIGYYTDPASRVVRPGTIVNVTVWWQALQPPGADYSIGTYLITPQGTLAQQFDSYPVGGFWPTATWREGDIIRNNVAFVLPDNLAPGFYEVWTVMYSPFDLTRLDVTDASGTSVRDHVLLFTIEVTR